MFGFGAPQHPQYPIISFICAIIILLPVSSHWKARNVATLSMIAWLFAMNVIRFIDTLVWANNVVPRWKIYCDITTKITIGVTIALPAAALCITKYLEQVASIRQTRQSKEQKRRRMIFEACMCWGLPFLVMALHYTTQGHRYDLYEHFGCSPATVITWVALVVLYIPPLVLSLISFVYATLAIRHFYYRRLDFIRLLQASNTGMSANRYVRLMLLALTEMCIDTAVNTWIIVINLTLWDGLVPYVSWANIHFNFSRIQPYPQFLVPPAFWRNTVAAWYVIPIATVMFWSFFAFGQESMAEYRSWYNWFRRVVLRKPVTSMDSLPSAHKYNPNHSAGRSTTNGSKKFFKFKIGLPKLRGSSTSSDSEDSGSPSTPTVRGKKFELDFNEKRGKDFSIGDNESFVSDDKPLPLSPISPMTPVSTVNSRNMVPATYMEADLDTSVFDTISHVTIPSSRSELQVPIINEPRPRSESPEIQQLFDDRHPSDASIAYLPSLHGITEADTVPVSPSMYSVAFQDTAVPRSDSPQNTVSHGVKVEVDIDVV